ncbi:ABC transporter ATP-binding protein [Rhodanobacter denitrificans]|uniref:ABC transporter ATP-binding protein n=1 Tax=Rhodanobacter denitrificans TaxID=666685 RepID=A0A368KI23_9GAMM|nr:ABC transporter ATP-binding protein [Rhodanobacter denitrificans]RCS31507.1 ABC transporter ATP-binding protein [Rhodanobacter denitrificans]
MSSEISIRVDALGKAFPIYDKPHHRLMQMIAPGPKDRWYRTFHALNNVSFEVHRGETVGIVGRNGSGKSTLLQLICGTLTPSVGSVQAHGRIAALLELGAGFNPDFTGRENVYLNGSLLGLTRQELNERFDDIAAFADIGEFIEQPVKSYSSGMYIRLAFAVAINVTPDILVIDEALSVGDEAFQRKCFARIDAIRDAGATVLFVSHSAGAVIELCDRALLLDRGELIAKGTPKHVVSHYHKLIYAPADKREAVRESIRSGAIVAHRAMSAECVVESSEIVECEDDACFEEGLLSQSTVRYVPRGATIEDPHIETLQGRRVNVLRRGQEYVYSYRVSLQRAAAAVRFGMMIKTLAGFELGGAVSAPNGMSELVVVPGQSFVVRFRFRAQLAPGTYFTNAGVTALEQDGETFLDRVVDAVMFKIMPDPYRLGTGSTDFLVDVEVNEPAKVPA